MDIMRLASFNLFVSNRMPRDLFIVAVNELIREKGCACVIENDTIIDWRCKIHEQPTSPVIMAKLKEIQEAEPMRELRMKRGKLLTDTDKYMTMDYPMTDDERNAMREYRQVLRDLPQNNITEIPNTPETLLKFIPPPRPPPKPHPVEVDEPVPSVDLKKETV